MASLDDAQEARRLVQHISEQHGYLSPEETREAIPDPEKRRRFELAMLRKDEMIGSSVITLAKNLYSSRARFVLEMLQNADDNSYRNARSAGQTPYISFAIYPDCITVECNEDGFNEANLSAICSIGKSSKTVAQGYIGEKGIGFKSVFMVAWKVHIQSRAFSFSFTHGRQDSGMGMISPVWEEITMGPPQGVTRITLFLHEEAISGHLRRSIDDQFANLQETFLLFMKNLQKVSVTFYKDSNLPPSTSTSYSVSRPQPNRAAVQTVSTNDGTSTTTSRFFHITTRQANNLPRNENRQYSDTEVAARAYSTAEVMLAFPLTEDSEPIIQPQSLFVFLPVRSVGFNFLVQADFVTDASRQDIVSDSPRNRMLVEEVARTFTLAVKQFCQHPTLLYRWMRYMPPRNDQHRGALWSTLVDTLAVQLKTTPALVGRRSLDLHNITKFVRPASDVIDQFNEPLLRDGHDPGDMISSSYTRADLETLEPYGLRLSNYEDVIRWVRLDLKSPFVSSRIQSNNMPDDWYTRVAKLLKRPFLKKWQSGMRELKSMRLVPLSDGSWTFINLFCPVYSECENGLKIPPNLDFRVLSPKTENAEMLSLYRLLGLETAPVDIVEKAILDCYKLGVGRTKITLEDSRAHLHFLYQSCDHISAHPNAPKRLYVFDSWSRLRSPTDDTVYIQNHHHYGPWELFRETGHGTHPGAGAPGFKGALFLHQDYFTSIPNSPAEVTWTEWLKGNVGVKDEVYFNSFEENGQLRYLQKHRPEKFLGALRESHMRSPIPADIIDELQNAVVLCKGGKKWILKSAFFPTVELEEKFERYVGTYKDFPWLWIDNAPQGTTHGSIPEEWKSLLHTLQVGIPRNDIVFGLEMLECISWKVEAQDSLETIDKLFDLYRHLASRFHESDNREESKAAIRNFFAGESYLYVGKPYLAEPEECVWEAPVPMESVFVLSLLWKKFLEDDVNAQVLPNFFKNIVGVPKCSYKTYIDELLTLKGLNCDNIDTMRVWYKALDKAQKDSVVAIQDDLKSAFGQDSLIYLPSEDNGKSWHKISDCIWSDAATLRNKASLNEEYADLEHFFVETLGVQRINLEMAIEELKDAGRRLSFSEVKASISTLSSLLEVEDQRQSSLGTEGNIFPVREADGSLKCVNTLTQFFVVDRSYEWQAFESRIRFLDFSLEEVAKLRPFLRWANIEGRLLSRCVKEVTSLGDGASSLVLEKDQQIANRAHALLRIAVHSGSPRTHGRQNQEALYRLLQNAQVYCTDSVVSGLQLSQDGRSHIADGKSIAVYLREDDTRLEAYLPKAQRRRKHAFNNILPKNIIEWIMTDPVTHIRTGTINENITAMNNVFTSDRSMLEMTLDDNGIATIDIDNQDEIDSSETASVASDEDFPALAGLATLNLGRDDEIGLSDNASTVSGPTDDDRLAVYTPAGSTEAGGPSVSASSRHAYSGFRDQPFSQERSPFDLPMGPAVSTQHLLSDDSQYIELLQAVITAARQGSIPMSDAPVRVHLGVFPDDQQRFRFRHTSQIERDFKVGAAGELYVFELLSHLAVSGNQLPDFTRSNWQSNVRKYVAVHPEYSTLASWNGPETSDIVYTDSGGILTSLLVAAGYLNEQDWLLSGRRPKYYIEVKATTSSCETPFYMSKAQYARMERNVLSPDNTHTIYVIFRIYNLGRDSMGLKIYMDPGALKANGSLLFTGEQWSVKPGPL